MRYVRAVRVRTPETSRDEYLELLERFAKVCEESEHVKGFYVMENDAIPGDFLEFVEYPDEAGCEAFAAAGEGAGEHGDVVKALRALIPPELVDSSFWQQRI